MPPPADRLRPSDAASIRAAVADVVLGDTPTRAGALERIASSDTWREALELALAWRVVPQVTHVIREQGATIGPEAGARARALEATSTAESTLVVHRAATVLDCLAAAGVGYAAIKGCSMIAHVYGTPAARMMSDLDVIIDEASVRTAYDALIGAGLEVAPHIGFTDLSTWLGRVGRTSTELQNRFLILRSGDGLEVDLHWRLGQHPPPAMSSQELLARAVTVDLAGSPVSVSGPVDTVLLTAFHAARSQLAPSSTVKDVADLQAWSARSGGPPWSVGDLTGAARRAELEAPLLALARIGARRDPSGPLALLAGEIEAVTGPRTRRAGARMAALFEEQVSSGEFDEPLMRFLARPGRFVRARVSPAWWLKQASKRGRAGRSDAGADHTDEPDGPRRWSRVARDTLSPRRLARYLALVRSQRKFR